MLCFLFFFTVQCRFFFCVFSCKCMSTCLCFPFYLYNKLHVIPPSAIVVGNEINLKHSVHICEMENNAGKNPFQDRLRLPFANLVGVQLDQWAKAHTII